MAKLKTSTTQKILVVSCLLTQFTGCSWMSRREAIIDSPGDVVAEASNSDMVTPGMPPQNKHDKVVSKVQYEQLAKKYDELYQKYQQNALRSPSSKTPNPVTPVSGAIDLSETVDVFAKTEAQSAERVETSVNNKAAPKTNESVAISTKNIAETEKGKIPSPNVEDEESLPMSENLEEEITYLRRAFEEVEKKNYDQATKAFKLLQTSKNKQISVRAKFGMGEILFRTDSPDLALQSFEDIIQNHAFSGVVIPSLGRIIACCEKLQLADKKDKYYSILHDFFGQS